MAAGYNRAIVYTVRGHPRAAAKALSKVIVVNDRNLFSPAGPPEGEDDAAASRDA